MTVSAGARERRCHVLRSPAHPHTRLHCFFFRARVSTPFSPSLSSLLSLSEYNKIVTKTALGFVVMGTIGFFVKLVFIVSCLRGELEEGDDDGGEGAGTGERKGHDTLGSLLYLSTCTPPPLKQPINQIIVGGSAKE